MKKFIRVMKALSDPGRVRIMKALEKKEMCVCEIQALVGLSQPTISKHMSILEDAGLVQRWKDKLWVNYRLADGRDSEYAGSLLQELQGWLNEEKSVMAIMKKVSSIDRLLL